MANMLQESERVIITSLRLKDGNENLRELTDLFLKGQYEEILLSDTAKVLFCKRNKQNGCFQKFCDALTMNVEEFVSESTDVLEKRCLDVMIVAVSCLQLYVQNNWVGPSTVKSPLSFCDQFYQDQTSDLQSEALEELSLDGEQTYAKSQHLLYLYMAKLILLDCRSFFTKIQTWNWWLMRYLQVQQALLPERSPTLKETVFELIEQLEVSEPLMTDPSNRDVQILFHLEAGHACHLYLEYKKATEHFNTAKKISGLDVHLTGVMGKRTKFQDIDKAQLVLCVQKSNTEDHIPCAFQSTLSVPKNCPIGDDTVLEDVKYTDDYVSMSDDLSPFENCLILGLMESFRRAMAQDRLTTEEVITYLSFLIQHSTSWSVTTMCFHLRSKLQKDSSRRVERSMMQLELLVKTALSPDKKVDVNERIPFVYAANVAPLWTLQGDFASILISLGCNGDALNVYERLEMWEEVISCYQRMGKMEKAESVIRQRLAIKETPTLLCFLGDVTRDPEHYQKAWELSGHRSAKAMRCLGYLHFHKAEYEKALECFATSLEKNALQVPVWFTYGCTAMACRKFDVGVKAFHRCVIIDYDNFEAWSNLATCYARLGKKKNAYATLQDALKCNFDDWRLWENSLIIGTDIGEFEDVIRSYNRLIDLKNKWIDIEVLKILTRAVIEKIPDVVGNPADRLAKKLMELFGRVTSKVTSEGEIWLCYSKLAGAKLGDKEANIEQALQHLQKAYRCFTQKSDWEKDLKLCKHVSENAIELAGRQIESIESKSPEEAKRTLSATKLMMKGALVKIQRQHTDPITQEMASDASQICQNMESELETIMSKIREL